MSSSISSLPPNSLVLVTGVTGFIGSHTAFELLNQGFRVRAAARDPDAAQSKHLINFFQSQGYDNKKFEIVKAADLEEPNVFDEAVKGVDGIIHVASPVRVQVSNAYKDLIDPAVNGTLSILNSALKYGNNVKQVVITSSVAALLGERDPSHIYTEADWNDEAVKKIEADPVHFDGRIAYRASKNAAERAGWKFLEDNKNKVRFGLSTILPSLVIGPVIHYVKDLNSLNASSSYLFSSYFKNPTTIGAPLYCYVDVRDVAKIHVDALLNPQANGKRIIASARPFIGQEVVDVLKAEYPTRKHAEGGEGAGVYESSSHKYDNSRSKQILGIEYIDLKKSVIDSVESLKQFW